MLHALGEPSLELAGGTFMIALSYAGRNRGDGCIITKSPD